MLLRSLVVVGWMGLASLIANVATAEDAVAPDVFAISGVSFHDPAEAEGYGPSLNLSIAEGNRARFTRLNRGQGSREVEPDLRQVEIALVASGASAGLPIDVAFAQRASVTVNENGDIERRGQGAELRLGRGLASMPRRQARPWNQPAIYFFAASEDEALTWQPGVRNAFGGRSADFALQDRVEIGDMQAGITYEAGGLQASLAYVEREISVQRGAQNFTQDESFTGLTLTMRR